MRELPSKWAIKTNKDVIDWFGKNSLNRCLYSGDDSLWTGYFHYPLYNNADHHAIEVKVHLGYTEISFDDFKRLVLKQSDNNMDNVNSPKHYTSGKIECIDALESATINKKGIEAICVANIIKYLWRYEDKNGKEDVLKAKWYLDKLIDNLK